MTDAILRPRRSVLYMPGANERALEKAKTLPADALILDLEDAVAPDAKAEARERVAAAAASGEYGYREVTIRVNGTGTAWHADDLRAAAEAGPDAVVVPKVDSAETVRDVERALEAAGAPDRTADLGHGRDAARDAATPARSPPRSERLTVLVMGTNDLAKELHAEHVPGRAPLLDRAVAGAARRPRDRQGDPGRRLQRRARTPRGSRPSACRAGSSASTARR